MLRTETGLNCYRVLLRIEDKHWTPVVAARDPEDAGRKAAFCMSEARADQWRDEETTRDVEVLSVRFLHEVDSTHTRQYGDIIPWIEEKAR